jgi:hypothetical protein
VVYAKTESLVPEYKQVLDPKTGKVFNVKGNVPTPEKAAATSAVADIVSQVKNNSASANAQVAANVAASSGAGPAAAPAGNGDLMSLNEMAAITDPREKLIYSAGQKGGDFKKGHTVTVEGAIPDDPAQAAWREESTAAKMGIADQEADIAIQQNEANQVALEQSAAQQQLAMQDEAAKLAKRELAVEQSMAELDTTIKMHQQQWQRGTSTGSELFDGSFGAGNMLSVIGITLAGIGGPEYQANAMNMVNQSLDRAIESQRFAVDSMFKQLENKFGSAEIARESLKCMQLKYAETMADLYAGKNLSPQIAINLSKLKVQLMDQYMASENKVRELTIGQVQIKEEFKHQEEIKGGWHAPRTQEEIKSVLENDKRWLANVASSGEIIGGDGKPVKMAPGDAASLKTVGGYDGARVLIKEALLDAGASLGADGEIDPASLEGVNLSGLGFWRNLPGTELAAGAETTGALNKFRQAVTSAVNARRNGKASAESIRLEEKLALGGLSEREQINSIMNYYRTLTAESDNVLKNVSPQVKAQYEKGRAELAGQDMQNKGDKGLRMKEVQ